MGAAGIETVGGHPVLVDASGTAIPLRPTVARLLSALIHDAGDLVPADELIRRTWGDSPPADPSASLHTTVARLRRHLPDDVLRREPDGYVLDLPASWVRARPRRPVFTPVVDAPPALVGRHELLAELRRHLADGRSVVIHGGAGVGRSSLVERLVADAAAAGRSAVLLRCRSVGADVPLGVYAPVLREVRPEPGLPVLVAARAAIVQQLDGSQLVLGIDDLHQVDPLSAVLTAQLVHGGHAQLVGSHRSLRYVPPAVSDLWHDGLAMHVHVRELPREVLPELVAALDPTPGRRADEAELDELWRTTNGNPLFVGVVLRRGGPSSAGGDPTLDSVIADQLGALSPELADTLAVVAVAEPVRLEVLEHVADTPALVALERALLIRLERQGSHTIVRLRHPLYGEHVRATASRLLVRSVKGQLADALEREGPVIVEERLRMARWALDAGRVLDAEAGAALARLALQHDDLALARRIADAVWARDRFVPAAEVLAEAAYVDRPGSDVLAVVEDALTEADDRQAARLRVVGARAALLKSIDPVRADALLAPLAAAGAGARAQLLAYQGRGREALDLLEPPTAALGERRLADVVAAATALTQLGRADEALALLHQALSRFDGADPRTRLVAHQLTAATSRPLMVLGRLDEAESALRVGLAASAEANDHLAAAMNRVALGGLLPWLGRPLEALQLAVHAVGQLERSGHLAMVRWGLMSAGFAAVVAGDHVSAAEVLERLRTVDVATMTDGVEPLVAGGLHALRFERGAAVDALLDGAATCERRELVFEEACARHELVRVDPGRRREIGDPRLAELGAAYGGFVATFSDHAAAIASGDAAALEECGEHFARHGALALAADALGRAAERAMGNGAPRTAHRLADRAADLADHCDPGVVRRPLLATEPLTPREREIAEMAAAGWPNQRISAQLGLSARTVENHLSRVFQKLAIEHRAELASLVGVADRPARGVE